MSTAVIERYGQRLYSHTADNEQTRLTALAAALDPATRGWIERLNPQAHWQCLELGAGAGTVAQWLSERCPDGRVIATELNPGDALRRLTSDNLEIMQHDVTVDDFPVGSFDFIHARWMFLHLRNRMDDLRKVVSWLAPGGWLLIEDAADFPIESSPHPAFRKVTKAMIALVEQRLGTDHAWARRFPAPLFALGLGSVGVGSHLPVVGAGQPLTEFWRGSIEQLASSMLSAGTVSDEDIELTLQHLADPEFSDFGMACVAAWGQRLP